jgi:YcxB-like protein
VPVSEINFQTSFAQFRQMQNHMAARLLRMNKRRYTVALLGVVFCAFSLVMAIVFNVHPSLAMRAFGGRYPEAIYFSTIVWVCLAILFLLPGVALRKATLRMQVADDGPLFGPTRILLESDGLSVERKLMQTKYMWPAVQSVEESKGAVVIAIDNGIGVIVPASAFDSAAEKYEFMATVSKRSEAARTSGSHRSSGGAMPNSGG